MDDVMFSWGQWIKIKHDVMLIEEVRQVATSWTSDNESVGRVHQNAEPGVKPAIYGREV